ncbi:MAG: hypothetical protein ABI432_13600 [Flavobacteriales bacterium]
MPSGYRIADQQALQFLTFAIVEWMDVLTQRTYRDIVLEGFRYYQDEPGLLKITRLW